MKKNVQKGKTHPKRSLAKPVSDHGLGLWVDYALLRKYQGRPAETVLHPEPGTSDNRYLQLADLVLKAKPKKKEVVDSMAKEKAKKKSMSAAGD